MESGPPQYFIGLHYICPLQNLIRSEWAIMLCILYIFSIYQIKCYRCLFLLFSYFASNVPVTLIGIKQNNGAKQQLGLDTSKEIDRVLARYQ